MTAHLHQDVEAAFHRFAAAVTRADSAAFEALCCRDVPPQTALFHKNATLVKDAGGSLLLRRVETQGDMARVQFDVRSGAQVHQAELVLTREPEGWRIRAL